MMTLDESIGKIWRSLQTAGIEKKYHSGFTADHGDLFERPWLLEQKQQPCARSIKSPLTKLHPAAFWYGWQTSPHPPEYPPMPAMGLSDIYSQIDWKALIFQGMIRQEKIRLPIPSFPACSHWAVAPGQRRARIRA